MSDVDDAEDTAADDGIDGDEDDDIDGEDTVEGALSRGVLEYLAQSIVDEQDGVEVEVDQRGRGIELRLHVAPDDMGKIIGRRGRVAQAIRTVVRAAGAKEGIEAAVDIVD
jgi:predicted RNA-binding protein YlqC (UPF0109 family)